MVTGLAAMKQARKEHEEAVTNAKRPKANWFGWKGVVGDTQVVQFMQELDAEATGYSAEAGLAIFPHEHVSPGNYQKRAECILESEGRCAPDEWHNAANASGNKDYKGGWRAKVNFYITVLAKGKDDAGKEVMQPQILSRNFYSTFVEDLIDIAETEGTITDRKYIIKKSGSDTTTRWSIKEYKEKGKIVSPDVTEEVAYDLKASAVRTVSYDEQAAFFEQTSQVPTQDYATASSARTTPNPDEQW